TSPRINSSFKDQVSNRMEKSKSLDNIYKLGKISHASPSTPSSSMKFDRHYSSTTHIIEERSKIRNDRPINNLLANDETINNLLPDSLLNILNDPKQKVPLNRSLNERMDSKRDSNQKSSSID